MSDDEEYPEFKDLEAWPGYRVGRDGSVWSSKKNDEWRKMTLSTNMSGHIIVGLTKDKKIFRLNVGVLVITAFRGVAYHKNDYVCLHSNGLLEDCTIDNLMWGSLFDAQEIREEHSLDRKTLKKSARKLTADDILDIRLRYGRERQSYFYIGRQYGITAKQVVKILKENRFIRLPEET